MLTEAEQVALARAFRERGEILRAQNGGVGSVQPIETPEQIHARIHREMCEAFGRDDVAAAERLRATRNDEGQRSKVPDTETC